jgi:hypothetical protein
VVRSHHFLLSQPEKQEIRMNQDFITGTVEGTGSAINVQIGFQPKSVTLFNIDGGPDKLEWTENMGAGKGWKTIAVGTMTFISSNGVTQYAGTVAGDSEGFTIGADADINVNAETICYKASR